MTRSVSDRASLVVLGVRNADRASRQRRPDFDHVRAVEVGDCEQRLAAAPQRQQQPVADDVAAEQPRIPPSRRDGLAVNDRPVRCARLASRRALQRELGLGVVGDDIEPARRAVPSPGVVDAVLDSAAPRLDQDRTGQRLSQRNEPDLGGVTARRGNHREPPAAGGAQGELVPAVGFAEHQHVVGGAGADAMPPDLEGPVQLIGHEIEQDARVGRPGDARVAPGDVVGQVVARPKVPDPEPVDLSAAAVGRPGEQVAVRAGLARSDVHVAGRRADDVLV